jgi:hypothetical protein
MPHEGHKGQDYFDEGAAACLEGEPKSSNPHIDGSREHEWWNSGWMVTNQELNPDVIASGPTI